jgi:hypothetical protein
VQPGQLSVCTHASRQRSDQLCAVEESRSFGEAPTRSKRGERAQPASTCTSAAMARNTYARGALLAAGTRLARMDMYQSPITLHEQEWLGLKTIATRSRSSTGGFKILFRLLGAHRESRTGARPVSHEMAAKTDQGTHLRLPAGKRWRYPSRIRALGKQMSRVALVTRVMWKAGNRGVGAACTMYERRRFRFDQRPYIHAPWMQALRRHTHMYVQRNARARAVNKSTRLPTRTTRTKSKALPY